MEGHISTSGPWNKGKLIGQKAPHKPKYALADGEAHS